MNIIELYDLSQIYDPNAIVFTNENITKVESHFQLEKKADSSLDNSILENLILAMKEYPRELLFISRNRVLYNLFSNKNYSRQRFFSDRNIHVETELIKKFIQRFLLDSLNYNFDVKFERRKYDELELLLEKKEYLPNENVIALGKKFIIKIDLLCAYIDQNPFRESTNNIQQQDQFSFLVSNSFFSALSYFSSSEVDEKIRKIAGALVFPYLNKSDYLVFGIIHYSSIAKAMASYKTENLSLSNDLLQYKNKIEAMEEVVSNNNSRSSSMSPIQIIILVIAVLKLLFFLLR